MIATESPSLFLAFRLDVAAPVHDKTPLAVSGDLDDLKAHCQEHAGHALKWKRLLKLWITDSIGSPFNGYWYQITDIPLITYT